MLSLLYGPTLTSVHDYWLWLHNNFVVKVIFLLFNMLSRFVTAFLLRSKHLLISWLQSLSTVILKPKKIKSVTISTFSLSICHVVMGPDATILVFWMLNFKLAYFPLSHSSRGPLVPLFFFFSAVWKVKMVWELFYHLILGLSGNTSFTVTALH